MPPALRSRRRRSKSPKPKRARSATRKDVAANATASQAEGGAVLERAMRLGVYALALGLCSALYRAGGVTPLIQTAVETTREQVDVLGKPVAATLYIIFVGLWVAACLPITLLEVAPGAIFGFRWGMVCAICGKNLGNYICFIVGRYLARDYVRSVMLRKYRVLRAIDRMLARDGFKVVLMVRLAYLPMPLKNYGLSVLDVSFVHYAAAALLTGLPFAVMWVTIGTKIANVQDLFSGKVQISELMAEVTGSTGGPWAALAKGMLAVVMVVSLARFGKRAWHDIQMEEMKGGNEEKKDEEKRTQRKESTSKDSEQSTEKPKRRKGAKAS